LVWTCRHPSTSSSDPTRRIQKNPSDPKLFSNRALTRVKIHDWSGAETDARKAIELYGPKNSMAMKAYYTLSEALLGLKHPREALETAKYAYKICLEIRDSSSEVISRLILRTKQAQWQTRESARLGELNATLGNVEKLLQQQLDTATQDLDARYNRQEIGEVERNEEREVLENKAREQRSMVREAFSTNLQVEEYAERVSFPTWDLPHYRDSLLMPPTRSYLTI
jgi:STIP1 homology and U-box containing protein 1